VIFQAEKKGDVYLSNLSIGSQDYSIPV